MYYFTVTSLFRILCRTTNNYDIHVHVHVALRVVESSI